MREGQPEWRANLLAALLAFAVFAAFIFGLWQVLDDDPVRDHCEERVVAETAIPDDSPSYRRWIEDCEMQTRDELGP